VSFAGRFSLAFSALLFQFGSLLHVGLREKCIAIVMCLILVVGKISDLTGYCFLTCVCDGGPG
jgi:hypothetical protein